MAVVLISLGIVLLAALLLRRLVGIERGGWPATWAAVLLGEMAAIGVLQVVTGRVLTLGAEWFPLGLALVAGFSMLALALIELLARPAAGPRPFRVPHPVASLRRRFARRVRYLQVTRIALRQGLLGGGAGDDAAGSRLGRSLAATFEEAGGLFVKLGQAMASQPHLVTPGVAAELARLQGRVAPADPDAAMRVLRDELGAPDEVFAEFAPEPGAAASIGQTYFAVLRDGRSVVVKVQRPGVAESMERDLEILVRLADRLDRRGGWARAIGLKELTAGFAESTREELDFRIEAGNGRAAAQALKEDDPVVVPGVIEGLTTRRVLVQERVDGRAIGTPGVLDALSRGRRRELADGLLAVVVREMVGGGRFHADPHAGNVLLDGTGRLALIDFGAVGRLNRFERAGLVDVFRALQSEDPALLRQAALRIGTPGGRIDADALDREFARFLSGTVRPDGSLDPAAFGEILAVFRDFGIVLPRSATTLFRTLLTLLGTLDLLSSPYDLVGGVRRAGSEVTAPFLQPKSMKELLEREVLSAAPVLSRLPRDLDDVARALVRGELRTRVSLFSEPEDVRFLRGIVNRVVLGAIGAALAVASALLLTVPVPAGQASAITIVGGAGLFFAALLMLRVVLEVLRERT